MGDEWETIYEDDFLKIDNSNYEIGDQRTTLKENENVLLTGRSRLNSSLELADISEIISTIDTNIKHQYHSPINFFKGTSLDTKHLAIGYCLAYIKNYKNQTLEGNKLIEEHLKRIA